MGSSSRRLGHCNTRCLEHPLAVAKAIKKDFARVAKKIILKEFKLQSEKILKRYKICRVVRIRKRGINETLWF